MAGDDRCTPQGRATNDAAAVHHVDDGHLRAFVLWGGIREELFEISIRLGSVLEQEPGNFIIGS